MEQNKFIVDDKPVELVNQDWDVLVILDACRYDKFEKYYKQYFIDGKLSKAISPATHTPEFLYKCFKTKLDDTVYVSGNMFVNSKNIPLNHWDSNYSWYPKDYFSRIVDVWDTGFDKSLGTIPPWEINKHTIVSMDLNKHKRFIVHYMQPHAPFLSWKTNGENIKDYWTKKENDVKTFREKMIHWAFGYFSERTMWIIGNLLGRLPKDGRGQLYIKEGRQGYINHYENNLKIVLKYVKQLIDLFPSKKFLVISDHGDRLGEGGHYGHSKTKIRDRIITEVPWLKL